MKDFKRDVIPPWIMTLPRTPPWSERPFSTLAVVVILVLVVATAARIIKVYLLNLFNTYGLNTPSTASQKYNFLYTCIIRIFWHLSFQNQMSKEKQIYFYRTVPSFHRNYVLPLAQLIILETDFVFQGVWDFQASHFTICT